MIIGVENLTKGDGMKSFGGREGELLSTTPCVILIFRNG